MKDTDIPLANAIHEAFKALFEALEKAEKAGLKTHIYVPEGPGAEAAEGATVEVARAYRATN